MTTYSQIESLQFGIKKNFYLKILIEFYVLNVLQNPYLTVSTEIEHDIDSSFDEDSGLENHDDRCLRLRQVPTSSSNFTPTLIIHAQEYGPINLDFYLLNSYSLLYWFAFFIKLLAI